MKGSTLPTLGSGCLGVVLGTVIGLGFGLWSAQANSASDKAAAEKQQREIQAARPPAPEAKTVGDGIGQAVGSGAADGLSVGVVWLAYDAGRVLIGAALGAIIGGVSGIVLYRTSRRGRTGSLGESSPDAP